LTRLPALAGAFVAVSACSSPSIPVEANAPAADAAPARAGTADIRLLVKLARPWTDGAAIERRAAAIAGVPVRYLAATSPQWHALALRCAPAPECNRALRRLRADTSTFDAVEFDERRGPLLTN
jgi:hypothetical protein